MADTAKPDPGRIDMDKLKALRCDAPPPPDPASVVDLAFVPTDALHVDPAYQRRIGPAGEGRIRKMIREFSWARFGAITIARNGDRLAVIDGQHRLVAAKAVGAAEVPAVITNTQAEGIEAEAADFVGINTTRTSVAGIDKFRAAIVAGDPDAMAVHEILTELAIDTDVAAGYALKPNQTRAVAALRQMVKRTGRGITFTALEMLRDAQPDQPNLLTAFTVASTTLATAWIVENGGDLNRFHAVLASTDFETIRDEAAQLVKLQGGKMFERGKERLLKAYQRRRA